MKKRKWRKSSHSGGENNECVEVANEGDVHLIRDSTDPDGCFFTLSTQSYGAFIDAVRREISPVA